MESRGFINYSSLLITYYLLLIIYYLLFITYYLSLLTYVLRTRYANDFLLFTYQNTSAGSAERSLFVAIAPEIILITKVRIKTCIATLTFMVKGILVSMNSN